MTKHNESLNNNKVNTPPKKTIRQSSSRNTGKNKIKNKLPAFGLFLSFEVTNFRSIDRTQILNFEVEETNLTKPEDVLIDDQGIKFGRNSMMFYIDSLKKEIEIRKSLLLIGKNATGKSNILLAFQYFRQLVLSSNERLFFTKIADVGYQHSFKTFFSNDKPVVFKIKFLLKNDNNCYDIYYYEVGLLQNRISSELLQIQISEHEIMTIFNRQWNKKQHTYKYADKLSEYYMLLSQQQWQDIKEDKNKLMEMVDLWKQLTNDQVLFLTHIITLMPGIDQQKQDTEQKRITLSARIKEFFNDSAFFNHDSIFNSEHNGFEEFCYYGATTLDIDKKDKIGILSDLHAFGASFQQIQVDADKPRQYANVNNSVMQLPFSIDSVYKVGNKQVVLDFITTESAGTKKFLSYLELIFFNMMKFASYGTINNLWIDEIDTNLTHLIVEKIFQEFHQVQIPQQMICTTHDALLLNRNLFELDQIYIVSKNEKYASVYESLADLAKNKDINGSTNIFAWFFRNEKTRPDIELLDNLHNIK
jgi:hypothetical protein